MATTTNYGWTTPDDTALVKDGAAAIRTLGSSVDTTTKALNPSTTLGDIEYRSSTANTNTRLGIGTSGQALTVVAGAPSWAASATSVLTTTGDSLYASAANTLARLGIGTTGQVLTVAGGVPTWADSASGAMTLLQSLALSGSSVTSSTLSSSYKQFFVYVAAAYASTSAQFRLRLNEDSGSNYSYGLVENGGFEGNANTTEIRFGNMATSSGAKTLTHNFITIMNPSDTTQVFIQSSGQTDVSGIRTYSTTGVYDSSAAITKITLNLNTGSFSAGTAYIYGVN
jgi:hypothetical protein